MRPVRSKVPAKVTLAWVNGGARASAFRAGELIHQRFCFSAVQGFGGWSLQPPFDRPLQWITSRICRKNSDSLGTTDMKCTERTGAGPVLCARDGGRRVVSGRSRSQRPCRSARMRCAHVEQKESPQRFVAGEMTWFWFRKANFECLSWASRCSPVGWETHDTRRLAHDKVGCDDGGKRLQWARAGYRVRAGVDATYCAHRSGRKMCPTRDRP
jgi:hypothetical protein